MCVCGRHNKFYSKIQRVHDKKSHVLKEVWEGGKRKGREKRQHTILGLQKVWTHEASVS